MPVGAAGILRAQFERSTGVSAMQTHFPLELNLPVTTTSATRTQDPREWIKKCDLPWEQWYAQCVRTHARSLTPEQLKLIGPFPEDLWDKLRYKGARLKDQVMTDVLRSGVAATRRRRSRWEWFKWHCPDWVPWVLYAQEPQWPGLYDRKRPRRSKGTLFVDLPPHQRAEAHNRFRRFCERRGLAPETAGRDWRKPILAGQARRLACHPEARSSEWGRKMRRIKGGKHAQQRYRELGWHPLASVRKAHGWPAERPTGTQRPHPEPSYDETSTRNNFG